MATTISTILDLCIVLEFLLLKSKEIKLKVALNFLQIIIIKGLKLFTSHKLFSRLFECFDLKNLIVSISCDVFSEED